MTDHIAVVPNRPSSHVEFYAAAKQWVTNIGYGEEILWQESREPGSFTECEFLREYAWVVYCAGFREATVRRYFNAISLCFFDWASAAEIAENSVLCVLSAMQVLSNRRKHDAVASVAARIAVDGFSVFQRMMRADPVSTGLELPFIGEITSLHLAKNLGFDVAKPDRHLVRLKELLGYEDVATMCSFMAEATGDPIRVVDLVLWRYLERAADRRLCPESRACLPRVPFAATPLVQFDQ